jgi:hypothetical protein
MTFKFTTVKKLYKGEFQYNIVLTLAFCDIFKGQDKTKYTRRYTKLCKAEPIPRYMTYYQPTALLYNYIMNMENFAIRVSAPTLYIYTNDYNDITNIRQLVPTLIDSIGLPPEGLTPGTVYMPNTPYDFRVTLGSISKLNLEFIEWADNNNDKIKLQPATKKLLSVKPNRYKTGSQLYVKGEHTLLFVKLHLGNIKLSIDRILN